jgi:general secretion pathway protein I
VIRTSRVAPRTGGFTLIEVLVALAIVAIGMAAVLGALSSSGGTIIYLHDKTLAEWVALNHIAEQRLQPKLPQTGNTDGDVDFAGQKWHWRQETVATAVKGMIRMDVMVRPADSKAADDRGWYVTVSGIAGDAVSAPQGTQLWGTGTTTPTPDGTGTGTGTGNGTNIGGTLQNPTTVVPPVPTPSGSSQ